MFTPQQVTERLLASVRVTGEWVELPAATIWFAVKARYAPDVRVQLFWPEQFRNPLVTSRFPGVPLGVALADLARYCGVTQRVEAHGDLVLSVPPQRVEQLHHAIELEVPPLRAWQKVENLHV